MEHREALRRQAIYKIIIRHYMAYIKYACIRTSDLYIIMRHYKEMCVLNMGVSKDQARIRRPRGLAQDRVIYQAHNVKQAL